MQYTHLGNTGLEVSRICLGMMTYGSPQWRPWVLGEADALPVVKHAVDLGVNFFDTADMYSAGESEELTGRFVKMLCRREEVVIATKLYFPVDMAFHADREARGSPARRPNLSGLGRKRIFHAVDASLQRLGCDYIDLYQIHRLDAQTPIEETMEALHDVVKSGKVRYIGASSMWAWQFAKAQQLAKEHGWTRFVSMQNHYNLAYREEEREMIPLCRDQRVALIPWSPLARGFLAGNRQPHDREQGATPRAKTDAFAHSLYYRKSDFKVVQALVRLAQKKGVSPATLAYAWLLHKGVTAPIVGASKSWQIDQAVAALDVALSAPEMERLEAPYEPHPVLGHH
ncbi:MAG: putative oxidoreductase, YajO family [Burkholderiaceae bacterium]|jgi:aryl-alcohol dehydrogenase-like predicted oxidoreductase|nr:MAG: putative oxidoreductase, YajO family [Burkholderiaceae bacterium]